MKWISSHVSARREHQYRVTPNILAASNLTEMAALRGLDILDYSPVFDSAPYFFNAVHLSGLPQLIRSHRSVGNLRALMFLFGFMVAALILVITTIILPALRWTGRQGAGKAPRPEGLPISLPSAWVLCS